MKKLLFITTITVLAIASCKKEDPKPVSPRLPMSYVTINLADNHYSDSSNNDTTIKTEITAVRCSTVHDKDYATSKPISLFKGYIVTKNIAIWPFMAQRSDTTQKLGVYKTGLTYKSYGAPPEIRITDLKTKRNYSASDSSGVITITTYNENEIAGTFSFNVTGQSDGIVYPVTGDFKYKIK